MSMLRRISKDSLQQNEIKSRACCCRGIAVDTYVSLTCPVGNGHNRSNLKDKGPHPPISNHQGITSSSFLMRTKHGSQQNLKFFHSLIQHQGSYRAGIPNCNSVEGGSFNRLLARYTRKLRRAPYKTTILCTGPSMRFHFQFGKELETENNPHAYLCLRCEVVDNVDQGLPFGHLAYIYSI